MRKKGKRKKASETVIDLVLTISIVVVVGIMVQAALDSAQARSDLRYAVTESRALYRGLTRYYERNRGYPNSYAPPRFEPETLDPLRRKGYYKGSLLSVLQGGRVDAYDSPDDQGLNHEFWIEMTLASNPSVRLLVARSDDAPLSGGEWVEGVFVYRDGQLETD